MHENAERDLIEKYRDEYLNFCFVELHELKEEQGCKTLVDLCKHRMGKQNRCWNGEYRYWIWEGLDWRIYVSNQKGLCFEVRENLNFQNAYAAWKNFLMEWFCRRINSIPIVLD